MSSLTQEEADDLFDTLQAEIEAAAAQETELNLVLTRLEELILEDILAGNYDETEYDAPLSGSVTPSTASATPVVSEFGGSDTFIQQKSLALLPLLCRFPLFTPQASDRLVKLIVLVSKRLNPKELWLGLDSVFETSRVGLEALADGAGDEDFEDQDEDDEESTPNPIVQESPEHISLYLSRALFAVQIVLPRIHVKKPEKYLKPILDALTGCLTAIESPELRSQIVEPDLFSPTLLLVNFAKAIREAWTWAVTKQSEHDNTLQLALSRLYLLALRSLLPLCPEAAHIYSRATRPGLSEAVNTDSLKMILLEPAIVLDMDPLQALKEDFALPKLSEEHPEWPRHIQRTASHMLSAGLAFVDARISESDCTDILKMLSHLLEFVLEDNLDELLRSVTLDAVFLIGQTCTTGEVLSAKGKAAINGSQQDQLAEDTKSALQTLMLHFDEIAQRPPLSMNGTAPARKVLDLCESLVLNPRLETSQRDELITLLLKDRNPHVRSVGITILRKLVIGQQLDTPTLLPIFSVNLFDHDFAAGGIMEEKTHAWLVSLLNLVYLVNTRLARLEISSNPIHALQRQFMEELHGALKLAKASHSADMEEGPLRSQLQLEILQHAWQKANPIPAVNVQSLTIR